MIAAEFKLAAAAAVLLLAGVIYVKKIGVANAAAGAVGTAAEAAAGVAIGVGDVVGVPRTSQTQCETDKAAGKTWDASFSCGAGDFIGYLFGSNGQSANGGATASW